MKTCGGPHLQWVPFVSSLMRTGVVHMRICVAVLHEAADLSTAYRIRRLGCICNCAYASTLYSNGIFSLDWFEPKAAIEE